jgi:hypothetical protein
MRALAFEYAVFTDFVNTMITVFEEKNLLFQLRRQLVY